MHAHTGELPLPVLHLFSRLSGSIRLLSKSGPGFTLPANIGDLDPNLTFLNLGGCNLAGALCCADIRRLSLFL